MENNEISITLPYEIWQEIASACIAVADFNDTSDDVIEALRRTYYTIKAETR